MFNKNMFYKQFIGKLGEDTAAKHLSSKGYDILFRNLNWKWGELDLIARDPDGTLVFIEVKTLQCLTLNTVLKPEDNLTTAKLRKLQRTAQLFIGKHPELISDSRGWRIDLMAVCLTPDNESVIRHYENI